MKLVVSKCSPEIAVPMTVKMPDPITAPIPSAVSDHGPRVRLSECPGSSASRISLSMDFRASSWLRRETLLVPAGVLHMTAGSVRDSFPEYKLRSAEKQKQLQASSSSQFVTARSCRGEAGLELKAAGCSYRFEIPRANFLTFFFCDPRGVVRLALGAAFLRASRFTFLRSSLSVIFVVSATEKTSFAQLFRFSGFPAATLMLSGNLRWQNHCAEYAHWPIRYFRRYSFPCFCSLITSA
jgi:hypothetical protein